MSQSNIPFSVQWSQQLVLGKKSAPKHPLDVLARWTPPARAKSGKPRPAVNLALVIDRSGSMNDPINGHERPFAPGRGVQIGNLPAFVGQGGQHLTNFGPLMNSAQAAAAIASAVYVAPERSPSKLDLAKDAAWSAIQGLGAQDTVSIVSFDDQARVVCEGVRGDDRATLRQAIDSIVCGGMTALFDGWCEGARCVAKSMKEGCLNRVLLLTDGQANVGERSPDKIGQRVGSLADTGVSTSTFGVGLDYNEDLLQGVALAGDGNYYHIKGNDDFLSLFSDEFEGLANVVGRQARLKAEGEGWKDVKALNDFPLDASGQWKLPNLMAGRALEVVLEASAKNASPGPLTLTLTYEDDKGQTQTQSFAAQPEMVEKKSQVVPNQEVADAAAAQRVAQQKKIAMEALDRGDVALAGQTLRQASSFLACASGAVAMSNTASLNALAQSLDEGDSAGTRKAALYESYNTRAGKAR